MNIDFSTDYFPDELEGAVPSDRYSKKILESAAKLAPTKVWAEFGVCKGFSTRRLLNNLHEQGLLYLFDSWEGLPEDWFLGDHTVEEAGSYATNKLRLSDERAVFVDGWYKDTLPRDFPDQLGLVHIDCDLYSSTKEVLFGCNDYIRDGTVLVFDELWGYQNYRDHEYRAYKEWSEKTGKQVSWCLRDSEFAAAGIVRL